jgi:hypothetical protein
MVDRHLADLIEGKEPLEIEQLLGPLGSIIVEARDSLCFGNKIWTSRQRHAHHKIDDGLFGRSLVPRWQWVDAPTDSLFDITALVARCRTRSQNQGQRDASDHERNQDLPP